MSPDISIIIVSWNVRDLLDTCLTTIKKYTASCSYEVIVVDNQSADNSADMVRTKHPWVRLFEPGENLGFGRANNLGLREAKGRHVVYLNPDIELIEDAFGPMLRYLEQHPQVAMIGPKLLNSDRSHQNSVGYFPTIRNLVNEYFLRERQLQVKRHHPQAIAPVDAVLGACILARGEFIRRVGGFDETYFMYLEETDLCFAAHHSGYEVVYFPEVAMVHHSGKSSSYSEQSRQRSLHENRKSQFTFFRKNYGWLQGQLARLILLSVVSIRLPAIATLRLLKKSEKSRWQSQYYGATLCFLLHPGPHHVH